MAHTIYLTGWRWVARVRPATLWFDRLRVCGIALCAVQCGDAATLMQSAFESTGMRPQVEANDGGAQTPPCSVLVHQLLWAHTLTL